MPYQEIQDGARLYTQLSFDHVSRENQYNGVAYPEKYRALGKNFSLHIHKGSNQYLYFQSQKFYWISFEFTWIQGIAC